MDTTIRNLDERAYRLLKSRAATTGMTIGEAVNEAIRAYLAKPQPAEKERSLRDLVPEAFSEGTDRLSEEIDSIAYGA